jgi:hypothetical protein
MSSPRSSSTGFSSAIPTAVTSPQPIRESDDNLNNSNCNSISDTSSCFEQFDQSVTAAASHSISSSIDSGSDSSSNDGCSFEQGVHAVDAITAVVAVQNTNKPIDQREVSPTSTVVAVETSPVETVTLSAKERRKSRTLANRGMLTARSFYGQ